MHACVRPLRYRTMRLGLMWKPTDGIQNYLLSFYTHSADNGTSDVIEQINNQTFIGPFNIGCLAIDAAAIRAGLGNTHCGQTIIAASFVDKQYSSSTTVPSADPGAWLGAHGLLNASFDWTSIYGSAFDLELFGSNLTDRTYRISNSNVWNVLYFQSSIYGEPRMYGLQLAYHWDTN